MRRSLCLLALLPLALTTAPAWATVTQPNGTVMPVDSANGEVQLYTLFANRGEALDYQADGNTTPSVFSPLCDFKATLVLNQTASSLGVGWYNVDPNATMPPALADIHVIVPAGSPVGTTVTAADIKNDPAYAGGLIGFALVGWQTHYSEPKWNPVCTGCNPPGPWITAVIYPSKVTPNAYYLAFEDGSVGANPGDFNNDGDYNDYVYFFEGLTCSGGGQACDTGLPGVCAAGITQCSSQGVNCQQLTPAAASETCDGLDNDCNGIADEGDICPTGQVCNKGTCVQKCGGGEFTCPPPLVCGGDGYCVTASCKDISCMAGQVCVDGQCKEPCDGVVCPNPQVCRVGVCVDPCDGVSCDMGQVCDKGVCTTKCSCFPCAAGLACDATSDLCVEPSCVGMSCGTGMHCAGGTCVDSCNGASCPTGQVCAMGQCVTDPTMGAGGASSGTTFGIGGGSTTGTGMGGASASNGAGGASASNGASGDQGGCGCRAAGSVDAGAGALGLALALSLLGLGRRRRDSEQRS